MVHGSDHGIWSPTIVTHTSQASHWVCSSPTGERIRSHLPVGPDPLTKEKSVPTGRLSLTDSFRCGGAAAPTEGQACVSESPGPLRGNSFQPVASVTSFFRSSPKAGGLNGGRRLTDGKSRVSPSDSALSLRAPRW